MKKILALLMVVCLLMGSVAWAEEYIPPVGNEEGIAPKPTNVTLVDSKTVIVNIGTPVELGVTVFPEGADESQLVWSCSNKKIATVENGIVTPIKEGTATITVKTSNGKKDAVKVKVVDPYKPTKVELDQSGTVTLNMDETLVLNVAITPEEASNAVLKWTSSSKKIATVDNEGIVTPVKEGATTITVQSSNGKKDTVKVQVVDPYKPTKVELDQTGTVTLNMGEALQLNAVLQPETAQSTLKWTSSSKKIVTVDEEGIVTPVKEGTATITVQTANGKKDTVKVKVVDPYKPSKIELEQKGTVTLKKGEYLMLHPVLYPETAQSTLSWKSSSSKVVSVGPDGLVQAHKAGTATITVTTSNGKKASVKISVPDTADISVASVRLGQTYLGDPEVYIRFLNESSNVIDRIDFDVKCYDVYGKLIKAYNWYQYYECWYDATEIYPGDLSENHHYWTMYDCEGTDYVKIRIRKYHTADGRTVNIPSSKQKWIAYYPN